MPWFRCAIRGENFPLKMYDETDPVGFYAARWVEARDAAEAELKAADAIRRDKTFATVPRINMPMVYVDEIIELARKPGEAPGEGFTLFPMEGERT